LTESGEVRRLRDPATVRERCAALTQWIGDGRSAHFTIDRSRLEDAAQRVARLARKRFPDACIPLHSRWRHFEAGGVDRMAGFTARLGGRSSVSIARAHIDLALISVLLDGGAGPDWSYTEPQTGQRLARSEGLAVASLRAFEAGRFSSDIGDPLRVDARALSAVDAAVLADAFQCSRDNPLIGLEGRAQLLRRLGAALRARPETFTGEGQPGHLFDALTRHPHAPARRPRHAPAAGLHHRVSAARIFGLLLEAFSEIWPSGQRVEGVAVGDVWPHRAVGYVPFHKLSQWLAYSLLEPFEWAGVHVDGVDVLTGLAEYRNGGLLLDTCVIVPRDASFAARAYRPGDEFVVEWRALTVTLLDELADHVRERLGLDAQQLPLAAVLEAGTWAAGREIAVERRAGGAPPVHVEGDGTIF
jgi:hypothetical protein